MLKINTNCPYTVQAGNLYGPIFTYMTNVGGANANLGIPCNSNLVYYSTKYNYVSV